MPRDTRGLSQGLLVVGIGDDIQQFLDTIAADRRDNPKLGKMGPDRINHRLTHAPQDRCNRPRVSNRRVHIICSPEVFYARDVQAC